jgi:hypothetical protein
MILIMELTFKDFDPEPSQIRPEGAIWNGRFIYRESLFIYSMTENGVGKDRLFAFNPKNPEKRKIAPPTITNCRIMSWLYRRGASSAAVIGNTTPS